MNTKKWILREGMPEEIKKEFEGMPKLAGSFLFYRGIKTKENAEKFLNLDYEKNVYDPFKILNMEKAVERILTAIKNKEKIIIFSDYDADGVCSAVVIHDFFKKVGFENFHVHIPDRHLDGYGMTESAIDEFAEMKANLIITFDCGVTDCKEVEKANSVGIDVIITDHHLPQEKIPNALAVIDSKQNGDEYPFKFLSGAGVAFKLVQGLIKKGVGDGQFNITPGWEKWLLDLVCVSTIADMVPLMDENRALVYYGLQVLKKTRREGLLALLRQLKIKPADIVEDDISFMIAPRVNLASRMAHANTSFSLLSTESPEEAKWAVSHLEDMNQDRKDKVKIITDEIASRMRQIEKMPGIIVEGDESWHPGVLGIVANRLLETYQCPVCLWGKADAKEIKGSCRSIESAGLNMVDFVNKVPEGILTEAGGHALATGFTIKEGRAEDFKKEIFALFEKEGKKEKGEQILFVDQEISIDDVNQETYSVVEKFRPFGMDNAKPVFLLKNLEIFNVKKFGNGGIHLQLDFKNSNNKTISAVGFFADDFNLNLLAGQKIDLVASMEINNFYGASELRLRIVDLKVKL